jgi:putative nucleotidyltransferase with HDIG domain
LGAILVGIAPLLIFEYLRRLPSLDPLFDAPRQHFYIVSAASLLAGFIALAIGLAGRRQRNIEVSFLALGFVSLALIFAVHGLATPGFLLPPNNLSSIAAQLSIFVTAAWLALSSTSSSSNIVRHLSQSQGVLVPLWALLLAAVGATGLLWPHLVNVMPVSSPPLVWIVAGCTVGLLLITSGRYWKSYTYSRFPLQLAIVYAASWLAVAQWIMVRGTHWRLSWWLYHYLFLAATLALIIGIVWQYAQGTSLVAAVRGLFLTDPVEQLEAGLSRMAHAIIVATEARDPYTAGHSYRATLAAVRLASAMGLPAEKLRVLAQAGVVHDVGKIEIPAQIIHKPGKLTPDERAIVEAHPNTGFEICRRLGFMPEALDVIRHHHERWDGAGYPDRLAGEQIPLLARVLAVTDVYDALTSKRSYRGPLNHERARAHILEGAGKQFDPQCVEIWAKLTLKGPLVHKAPIPRPQRPALVRPA